MTVNKSQSQSFLQALFDTTVETFSHGQSYVALSRIRYYNTIRLIIKEENLTEKDGKKIATLLNCVYPSVILKDEDDDAETENSYYDESLRNLHYSNDFEYDVVSMSDSNNGDNEYLIYNNNIDNQDIDHDSEYDDDDFNSIEYNDRPIVILQNHSITIPSSSLTASVSS
jgi:hypothetical protein